MTPSSRREFLKVVAAAGASRWAAPAFAARASNTIYCVTNTAKLSPATFASHPGLKLLETFGAPFALQGEVGTFSYEQLKAILSFASEKRARWVELWHQDILNPKYEPLLRG